MISNNYSISNLFRCSLLTDWKEASTLKRTEISQRANVLIIEVFHLIIHTNMSIWKFPPKLSVPVYQISDDNTQVEVETLQWIVFNINLVKFMFKTSEGSLGISWMKFDRLVTDFIRCYFFIYSLKYDETHFCQCINCLGKVEIILMGQARRIRSLQSWFLVI